MTIQRRLFLRMTTAIGMLLSGGGTMAASSFFVASRTPMARQLVGTLRNHESATAIGHVYLDAVPAERSIGRLSALIETALERDTGGRVDGDQLLERFADVRRKEFRDEDVANVDGWVLSRTEARLCALRALS